jgi:hypothetical protein
MLYFIPDILLKVSINTNKTGHHVILYTDTLLKVSLNNNKTGHHVRTVLLVFNDTVNNVSGIAYNMLASFIGV